MSRFQCSQRDVVFAGVVTVLGALLLWRSMQVRSLNRELQKARNSAAHWHEESKVRFKELRELRAATGVQSKIEPSNSP